MSLGATTLLHQAYLDFAERDGGPCFPDKAHFMGYASHVIRGLIINHARNRHAQKRGGQFEITSFDTEFAHTEDSMNLGDLTNISDALDDLAKLEPAPAVIVDKNFPVAFPLAKSLPCRAFRNVRRSETGKKRVSFSIARFAQTCR